MRQELSTIFSKVFRIPAGAVGEDPSPDTIPAWDSLGHLQLVSALEAGFRIRFNVREIQTMDSGQKIEAVLKSRGL
jgi:acyl carrier protein